MLIKIETGTRGPEHANVGFDLKDVQLTERVCDGQQRIHLKGGIIIHMHTTSLWAQAGLGITRLGRYHLDLDSDGNDISITGDSVVYHEGIESIEVERV